MNRVHSCAGHKVYGKHLIIFYVENSLPNRGGGDGIERTKNSLLLGAPSYTLHHWELRVQFSNSFIFNNVSGVRRQGRKSHDRHPYLYGANIKGRGEKDKKDVTVQSTL